jgi:hypothetical protein
MTPTPPYHSNFQGDLRFAGRRRPRPANEYDASHHTPLNPHPHTPVTPLPDNGVEIQELGDDDDVEDEHDVEDIDVEEEGIEGEENDVDADEEEGGIEEGAFRF